MTKNITSNNTADPAQVAGEQSSAQVATSASRVDNETPTDETRSTDESARIIAELKAELKEANKQAAAERIKAKEKAEAARIAEEAHLKEQGEYKLLFEQREARLKELEPIAQDYADLAAQVATQIDAEIKDWPASVKALDPGPDKPLKARQAWVASARVIVAEMQQSRVATPGNAPGPKPSAGTPETLQNEYLKKMRGQYPKA